MESDTESENIKSLIGLSLSDGQNIRQFKNCIIYMYKTINQTVNGCLAQMLVPCSVQMTCQYATVAPVANTNEI